MDTEEEKRLKKEEMEQKGEEEEESDEEEEEEEDKESEELFKKMSYTDKALLHLARALIANPEVLVMQRPFIHYDEPTQDKVMGYLKEFVIYGIGACLPGREPV